MPRKIRDLESDLKRAGFVRLPDRGRGDHAMYRFPNRPDLTVTLDGRSGQDAKAYQEKQVRDMIQKSRIGLS